MSATRRTTRTMGHTLDLFDAARGRALREDAIQQVEAHAPDAVKALLVQSGRIAAQAWDHFTTDDIRREYMRLGGPPIREPRVLGAVMRMLVLEGVCAPTEQWTPSAWAANHRRPLRVWRSLCVEDH